MRMRAAATKVVRMGNDDDEDVGDADDDEDRRWSLAMETLTVVALVVVEGDHEICQGWAFPCFRVDDGDTWLIMARSRSPAKSSSPMSPSESAKSRQCCR